MRFIVLAMLWWQHIFISLFRKQLEHKHSKNWINKKTEKWKKNSSMSSSDKWYSQCLQVIWKAQNRNSRGQKTDEKIRFQKIREISQFPLWEDKETIPPYECQVDPWRSLIRNKQHGLTASKKPLLQKETSDHWEKVVFLSLAAPNCSNFNIFLHVCMFT